MTMTFNRCFLLMNIVSDKSNLLVGSSSSIALSETPTHIFETEAEEVEEPLWWRKSSGAAPLPKAALDALKNQEMSGRGWVVITRRVYCV